MQSKLTIAIGAMMMAGCAAQEIPAQIKSPPPGDLQLVEAQRQSDTSRGTPVRWGGTIMDVRESGQGVELDVLERKLDSEGRPAAETPSDGRFVIRTSGELDKGDYEPGRSITVSGTVAGSRRERVGKRMEVVPVVNATEELVWYSARYEQDEYWPYGDFYYSTWPYGRGTRGYGGRYAPYGYW